MIQNFQHRYSDSLEDTLDVGRIASEGNLTNSELIHLQKIREAWNFYEGYHWEGIDDLGVAQITYNYCRPFINKFVSFELGEGFVIKVPTSAETEKITVGDTKTELNPDMNNDGNTSVEEVLNNDVVEKIEVREKTSYEFLNEVWEDNNKDKFVIEMGQTKAITGEAWIKIQYESPEDLQDPFEEYPKGRIDISVIPTQFVFPQFNDHDKDRLESLLIMYPIRKIRDTGILFKRSSETTVMYKELWTSNEIFVYEGKDLVDKMINPYGFIPFVQIKNFPIAGRTRGVSDIDDVIPLNVELNAKKSDVSEIIDYHSAPITLIYGAKIGNLEKGANKVWGGLPKDAKVENLALQGDLVASSTYISGIKTAMCEIAGIPETVLGGAKAISNTSGVALQYMNLPLIERTKIKRGSTISGLQRVNKIILFISLQEGLISKPQNLSMKEFVDNKVVLPDTLPKDVLIELQKIEQEMKLGLECRHGAMERLNKDNIPERLKEIDDERLHNPELFTGNSNSKLQSLWYQQNYQTPTNAGGMMNGQTPIEQVRTEMTGQNGGVNE